MSLDVSLRSATPVARPLRQIFIREDGQTTAITRAEWDRLHPGREPVEVLADLLAPHYTLYTANITHNLNTMARHAGLYGVLWEPETCGIQSAAALQDPLRIGLDVLRAHPDWFAQWNPPNGWGRYAVLCTFVQQYLDACLAFPAATVEVSR